MNDSEKPDLPADESPPPAKSGRVPSLEAEQRYGGGKRRAEVDADIERELQEAMGGMTADELLAAPRGRPQSAAEGPPGRKKGKILRIHGKDVFVEVPGGRSQGVLPLEQFPEGPPKVGDEVEVSIEGAEDGLLLLSRKGAAVHADWDSVAEGMVVEARVTETNKGGLAVDVNGIRGFLPISQIDLYRIENAEQFVNQRLRCLVTEVDRHERNLVVSRRALLEKERDEQREKTWNELAEGQVRQGVVRSVKDFGAFVDVGGVDGLLHVSEMSWTRVEKAGDIVQPGQAVKVVVLKIDREHRKVGLGLRQLTPSPWDNIFDRYAPGAVVTGKVSRLADFGAFVELEPAIEGLIHISELAPQRVHRVKDIVQAGQEVKVMVLSVDATQHRISLSLKAALAKEVEPESAEEEEEEDYIPPPPRPRTTPLRGGLGD
jgi:small subunit ribosomal protein S1